MLWDLLAMDSPPAPEWWVATFSARAGEIETDERYSPRFGSQTAWAGSLSAYVEERVPPALSASASVREACARWGSGAVPAGDHAQRPVHPRSACRGPPKKRSVRAVNDTWDNDTIAAIVGAAVGALHGRQALPERWITGLSGRTRDADDGHVFGLLEAARARFAGPNGDVRQRPLE